jgi:integrase/recombinase XerC
MITSEELTQWTDWMLAAGRPETTIGLRVYHVRRVLKDLDTDPWSLSVEQLVKYLAGQRWAPETRRSYRASLRAFYAWAQATGRRADSPAHLLPSIEVPRGKPRPTPDKIYRTALRDADERARLMVALAAMCGLRRCEIARVRRDDVVPDLFGHSLRVIGKGGHVRNVPLPDLLTRELLALPPGWVFPSRAQAGGHLTPAHVGKIVSALMPDGWTTHTLRHRCATVAYAAGGRDLRAVQQLLGHAKPETTARYTQVPDDAVRAAVDAASAA